MITTGKTIYDLLKASTALTALVGTKIYPLVIPENAVLPILVYERSFENANTKDGLASSKTTINITILSENYKETIDIATAAHNALKAEAHLVSGAETYAEGAFMQNLVFTFWGV